jgi:hypothetical protein
VIYAREGEGDILKFKFNIAADVAKKNRQREANAKRRKGEVRRAKSRLFV